VSAVTQPLQVSLPALIQALVQIPAEKTKNTR